MRAAIIEAGLVPDTRLGEEELAAHYGISRTLIRVVLSRLVADGLVDTGRGKSARVAHPTLEEARDAFIVRRALERPVIETLAEVWTPQIRRRLEAHVESERAALQRHDAPLSGRLGGEFHIELAAATENDLLHRHVSQVVSRTGLILAIYGEAIDQAASIDEHRELIGLLAAGDGKAALDLASGHLLTVERKTLHVAGSPSPGDISRILSRF